MKKQILIIIVMVLVISCGGGSGDGSGSNMLCDTTWIGEASGNGVDYTAYITFADDGRYSEVWSDGYTFEGTYSMSGDTLTISCEEDACIMEGTFTATLSADNQTLSVVGDDVDTSLTLYSGTPGESSDDGNNNDNADDEC